MNCDEATNLMDDYLDGELDPVTSQTIEQHLRSCRNCEQAYETHRVLVRSIGIAAPYYKAPAVADLASEGFPLVGGRLDYLDNRPVAALVYQRRKHFINLFVWPVESNAAKGTETISRQGYQLLHWVNSDFNYWAVSDVNANDLQTLKQQ